MRREEFEIEGGVFVAWISSQNFTEGAKNYNKYFQSSTRCSIFHPHLFLTHMSFVRYKWPPTASHVRYKVKHFLCTDFPLKCAQQKFWYWFWYWGWENFNIDIVFDIEEIVQRILILILILKTKFLKILILILNKNLILCHVCCTLNPFSFSHWST